MAVDKEFDKKRNIARRIAVVEADAQYLNGQAEWRRKDDREALARAENAGAKKTNTGPMSLVMPASEILVSKAAPKLQPTVQQMDIFYSNYDLYVLAAVKDFRVGMGKLVSEGKVDQEEADAATEAFESAISRKALTAVPEPIVPEEAEAVDSMIGLHLPELRQEPKPEKLSEEEAYKARTHHNLMRKQTVYYNRLMRELGHNSDHVDVVLRFANANTKSYLDETITSESLASSKVLFSSFNDVMDSYFSRSLNKETQAKADQLGLTSLLKGVGVRQRTDFNKSPYFNPERRAAQNRASGVTPNKPLSVTPPQNSARNEDEEESGFSAGI